MNTQPENRTPGGSNKRKTAPDKAETALLEPFSGLPPECIFVPANKEEFASALTEIRAAGIVGFDTEAKPVFTKGVVSAGPDVVQFATEKKAFIFQLHRMECRPFLADILLSEDILKIGFDLRSDRGQLHKKLGIEMRAVLDLVTVFRKRGYRNTTGVRAAVGITLQRGFNKPKHVTTSDWSRPLLTPKQLEYAANDAYAALLVWTALGCPAPDCRKPR